MFVGEKKYGSHPQSIDWATIQRLVRIYIHVDIYIYVYIIDTYMYISRPRYVYVYIFFSYMVLAALDLMVAIFENSA